MCGCFIVRSVFMHFPKHILVMIVKMNKLFKAVACEGDEVGQ